MMTSLAESYAIWLADYYLLSTVLLLLALAGVALLKQPAQRLMVTKSTLAGLMLVAILCAVPGWSLVHLLSAEGPAAHAAPVIEEPMSEADMIAHPEAARAEPIQQAAPTVIAPTTIDETPTEPIEPKIKISLPAALAISHLVGVCGIIIWLALGWAASMRLRRTAQPAPASISVILDQLAIHHDSRSNQPQLFTHDRLDVAVALGVWRPVILLPGKWAASQSPDRLRAVLAHEATHVHNRDLQWVAVARALFVPLWANPLFWLAKRRVRLDQEALADAAAAEITSRQQYAEQLVAWAREARSRPALHLSSAVGLWESPSQLRQRVAILLDEKLTVLRNCSPRWRIATALTLLAGAAILSLVTIQPAPSQAAGKETRSNEADAPAAPKTGTLTMRFEYDGTPPEPKQLKEWAWRNKADNSVLSSFNIEKKVGAKVFDESLVVGKDRGIANVFVWVRSKDIPVPLVGELPRASVSYSKGRFEPHAQAFQAPRHLILRNDDANDASHFKYPSFSLEVQPRTQKEVQVVPNQVRLPMRVESNLYPWLSALVLSMEHPFVAVSDAEGKIRISDLPPGKWEFQVWHERAGYLKTHGWQRGRFTLEIKPGQNDLGTIKVSPDLLRWGDELRSIQDWARPDSGATTAPAPTSDQQPTAVPSSAEGAGRAGDTGERRLTPNTITGRALDEKGKPIAEAEVLLFRYDSQESSGKPIGQTKTNDNGEFQFANVIDIEKEFPNNNFPPPIMYGNDGVQGIVRKPGRATYSWLTSPGEIAEHGFHTTATMPAGATLAGRVVGPDGAIIAGALVAEVRGVNGWERINSARTDPEGKFKLEALQPFSLATYHKQLEEQKARSTNGNVAFDPPAMLVVEAPGFATKQIPAQSIPGQQDVRLDRPAIIEGHVVFEGSEREAGDVVVQAVATLPAGTSRLASSGSYVPVRAEVHTDPDGKYSFKTLPPGSYYVAAIAPGWATNGIPTMESTIERPTHLPDIVFTKGGIIAVRMVDARTSKPIEIEPRMRAMLIASSASNPPAGQETINHSVKPNAQGRFELQVPAGKRSVLAGALTTPQGEAMCIGHQRVEIDVVAGQAAEIDAPVEYVVAPASTKPVRAAGERDHIQAHPARVDIQSAPKKGADSGPTPKPAKTGAKAETAAKKATANPDEAHTAPITIIGQATGKNAQPVVGARIYVASLRPAYKRIAQTVTDDKGEYDFEKIALPIQKPDTPKGTEVGEFEVFGVADGYGMSWREPKFFHPQQEHITNESIDPKGDGPRRFGSADTIQMDLRFVEAVKVRGRVVDDQGKPIAGTLLDIRNADSQWDRSDYRIVKDKFYFDALNETDIVPRDLKTRTTDKDGNFEFTGLPINNRFWIWIHPPGFPNRSIWAVTNNTVDTKTKGDTVYKGDINLVFNTPRKVPIEVIFGDTKQPAPKVMVSTGGTQGGSGGSTNDAGLVTATLPDGNYYVSIEPRINTPYLNSKAKITVSADSVKKPAQVVLDPAAVVNISVVDADTGKPLAGVDLWRQQPNADAANGYRGEYGYYAWEVETNISHFDKHRTDKDGKMQVLFAPGRHRIGVGLNSYPDGYRAVDANGQVIELEAGKPQPIEFKMRGRGESNGPAPTKARLVQATVDADGRRHDIGGSAPLQFSGSADPTVPKPAASELTGRVVDADGKPLAGVTVDAHTWYPGNETKTDDHGLFSLKGFEPHEPVEIEFRKAGFGPRHFNVQHAGTPGWLIQMDNTTFMEGQVVDTQANPVPNVLIRAERKALNESGNEVGNVFTDTRTDKSGNFRLYLEPDTYGLKVRVPGRGVARYEKQSITKGEHKLFNINLEPGQTFRAVVLDAGTRKPVEGIILFNWQHKGTEGQSNAEGVLEVPNMFPGKFEFQVSAAGQDRFRSSVAGKYARWWSEQAAEPHQRQLGGGRYGLNGNWDDLTFDIGSVAQPTKIFVESCVTITGRVVDPDGNPVAGATVAPAATGSGNSITGDTRYSYETKSDGTFEMKLPASGAGQYNLIAHDGKYEEWRKWANVNGEPFRTKPGDHLDNVELRLTRPATIHGRVTGAARNPQTVRAADVACHDNRYYVPTTKTDAAGNFELKFVAPGKHIVQIEPFTFDPNQAPPGTSAIVDVKEGATIEANIPDTQPSEKSSSGAEATKNGSSVIISPNADKKGAPDEEELQAQRDKAAAPLLVAMTKEHGYALKPDQDIARIAPPFAPIRNEWFHVSDPLNADYSPEAPFSLFFDWKKGKLENGSVMLGSDSYDVQALAASALGLKSWRIEGPKKLLRISIAGDWVVRSGADRTRLVEQLNQILRRNCSPPVALAFRTIDRPVYVARGNYRFAPLHDYEKNGIQIYGTELVYNNLYPAETGSMDDFFEQLSDWIETPIVSELKTAPPQSLQWVLHDDRYKKDEARREDQEPNRVLAHITDQTGLTFTKEGCPIKVLFVEPAKP